MAEFVLFTPEQREKLQTQLRLQEERGSAPVWPTVSRLISQGVTSTHKAIDIAGNIGDPIYAPMAGKITDVRSDPKGYGLNVRILLESGKELILGHLSSFDLRPGEDVKRGQLLGALGSTGQSGGPHVHVEIREPGPDRFLRGYTSTTTALDPYEFFGKSIEFQSGYGNWSESITPDTMGRTWIQTAAKAAGPGPLSRLMSILLGGEDEDSEDMKLGRIGILGEVTIKPQPWWDIAAVGVGVIGLFIGVVMILKPSPGRIIQKILPAVKAVAEMA